MILITGATGNLGGKVARELIARGNQVRVTGRDTAKLEQLYNNTEVISGDLEDENFLNTVLKNIEAVFLIQPVLKNLPVDEFAGKFIAAADNNGVRFIVNISNCTLSRMGQPTSLLHFEEALSRSSQLHIKHLRCANFFENLNWGIHTPYKADIKLPYISSYEIAYVAANYLEKPNFKNVSVDELMGKADYSMQDFADKLGVIYKQLPANEEDRLFFEAFNTGQYEVVKRTPANTSSLDDKRFTLEHFLNTDFNKNT